MAPTPARRPSITRPPTRAFLLALSGGASLRSALLIAARSHPDRAEPFAAVARGIEGDLFRGELLATLPLEAHVKELLQRTPADALPAVAAAMLEAERRAPSAVPPWGALLFAFAVVEASVLLVLATTPLFDVALPASRAIVAAAAVTVILGFVAMVDDRRERLSERAVRLLSWMAVGDLARVPPGAVLAALGRSGIVGGTARLERLLLGAVSARDAAHKLVLGRVLGPPRLLSVVEVLPREPDAVIRLLDLAEALQVPPSRRLRSLAYVATAAVALFVTARILGAIAALPGGAW